MTQNEKALQLHKEWNGKIDTTPKCHVKSREDLALAYTPGVAEPCKVQKIKNKLIHIQSKATPLPLSPTEVPYWDWEISVPRQLCLLWKERLFSLRNLVG